MKKLKLNKSENIQESFLDTVINVFKMVRESWDALLINATNYFVLIFIPILALGLVSSFIVIPFSVVSFWQSIAIIAGFAVIAILLFSVLAPSIITTQLASVRGDKISLKESMFSSKKFLIRSIILAFLVVLSTIIGLILAVIPGILISFFVCMSFYLMIDKDLGVIEAVKNSFYLVKKHWNLVLAMFIVNFCISLTGYIPTIGWLISLAGNIAYFCLPAVIYFKIRQK